MNCARLIRPMLLGVLLIPVERAAGQQLSPSDSLKAMQVPAEFDVELVASEPLVRQPVCIEFDDRGRLWVIQYLQYPNPAGLNRVEVDRYSRTTYDRIPEPPPHGPRGADRITILKDADGDGRMETGQDFVNGLNLATGMAFGHGGVFVLNVPYLLFFPDRNRDDVPDGDPEVLLTGFGMQDAHSVANSLTWGPDGWLYGCQGSTVTANIRGIEFQQGVWRYRPETREFELFCEGGGNCWGLDFDAHGRLFYSTNYGGFVMVHGVQGGSFVKSFSKHGALQNPFAYGYFEHATHTGFKGGHVTVGGIVYQGHTFPESMRGKYIAGDLLGHGVYWHEISPQGSTVQTAHGGELLVADDPWFAPTDVTLGPDGAIYVSDWHDARTAHPDPDADWDRSNGRIYRIAAKGAKRAALMDFADLTSDELLDLHDHRSQWFVRRTRQELVRRADQSLIPELKERVLSSAENKQALEALWTLSALNAFDEPLAMELLDSPHSPVRAWTIRLMGDRRQLSTEMAHRLDELAEQEMSVEVRQQLACSACRWPADQAMPVINANINRNIDNEDPYLPLLWWWAVERHAVSGRNEVMRRFTRPSLWKSRLGATTLLPRLVRRYTAEGTLEGLNCVSELLHSAPNADVRATLWTSCLQGWRDLPAESASKLQSLLRQHPTLLNLLLSEWNTTPENLTLLQLCIMAGHKESFEHALHLVQQSELPAERRAALINIVGEGLEGDSVAALLNLAEKDGPDSVRIAALRQLGRVGDVQVSERLVSLYSTLQSEELRSALRQVILGRRTSALLWLNAADQGKIPASETPADEIRLIALLRDKQLDALVKKHWGQMQAATAEVKLAEVRRLNNDLRAGPGNKDQGRLLFRKHCAACHQLFGEGTKLGPDLTTANRTDRDFLLISLVDPSSVIRREYISLIVQTVDGRIESGLAVNRDDNGLTLVNSKAETRTFSQGEIEQVYESQTSHMPEELYRQLKPQDLRDLFAWLQSNGS
jgi:putative membrane-bound dehydrogenase-like protein